MANFSKKTHLALLPILLMFAVACSSNLEEDQSTSETLTVPEETIIMPVELAAPTDTPSPASTSGSVLSSQPNAAKELSEESSEMPWWNDAVFYEVFVRSFQDSDGDGVGDLNGLIERLDYLNDGDPTTSDDLGVTGLWLMPIMASPSYHGYDVVDYFQVDEEYGAKEDFQRLIEEVHAREMKVVVDLVLNHTGRDHPWFQEALDPDSEKRDWYVWEEENPGYRGPLGQQVWFETDDGYYYSAFWEGMPDLNLENPEVTDAMHEAARFWLEDMGADGFRLDAIKHLVEDGRIQENTAATHDWLGEFYSFYKGVNQEAFTVGEAWTGTQQVLDYTGDEVDIAFQFDLAQDIVNSSREGIGSLVKKQQAEVVDSFPPGQYATFITNHDQDRVMSQLRGDEEAAKIAASMLLTSPGVPFIYYGEEIGLVGAKPDEDIRRPMQWSADGPGAGFTDGTPWRPPHEDYLQRNVAAQEASPDSLLNHYRTLIHLRNKHDALRLGDWTLVDANPGRLYAFLRHTDDQHLLVLMNPSRKIVSDYSLELATGPLTLLGEISLLLGEGNLIAPVLNGRGGFENYAPLESLAPQSTYIIQLSP